MSIYLSDTQVYQCFGFDSRKNIYFREYKKITDMFKYRLFPISYLGQITSRISIRWGLKMKRNKLYFIALILLIFFVVGCGQQLTSLPYIKVVSSKQSVKPATSPYTIEFFVVNPMVSTFIGNLTYKYDTSCLSVRGGIRNTEPIQVLPKSEYGVSKEFFHASRDQYGNVVGQVRTECLQKPLEIFVYLYDAGGDFRGSETFILTLTQ